MAAVEGMKPLVPHKFYGGGLQRPWYSVDGTTERTDPPPPVNDYLLRWAKDAHWSMGGLSYKRHRLQGKIEGRIDKLKKLKHSPHDLSKKSKVSKSRKPRKSGDSSPVAAVPAGPWGEEDGPSPVKPSQVKVVSDSPVREEKVSATPSKLVPNSPSSVGVVPDSLARPTFVSPPVFSDTPDSSSRLSETPEKFLSGSPKVSPSLELPASDLPARSSRAFAVPAMPASVSHARTRSSVKSILGSPSKTRGSSIPGMPIFMSPAKSGVKSPLSTKPISGSSAKKPLDSALAARTSPTAERSVSDSPAGNTRRTTSAAQPVSGSPSRSVASGVSVSIEFPVQRRPRERRLPLSEETDSGANFEEFHQYPVRKSNNRVTAIRRNFKELLPSQSSVNS